MHWSAALYDSAARSRFHERLECAASPDALRHFAAGKFHIETASSAAGGSLATRCIHREDTPRRSQEEGITPLTVPPRAHWIVGNAAAYANRFSGKIADRIIAGGVGRNLPQEAPQPFAQAVVGVDRF
jgi:hypothetical protein